MPAQGRKAMQLAVAVGLSGLFLWLALRGQDWQAIRASLASADYRFIALIVPLGIYGLYARCQRWRILLEKTHRQRMPMLPIFSASAIGFMGNMVLPFRVGEIARPLLVSRAAAVPVAATFATVVVERVLDLLALAIFGLGIVLTADVPPAIATSAQWAAGAAVVLLAGVLTAVAQRETVLPILDRLWSRIPKVGPVILRVEHEFVQGMSPIADLTTFARTVAWSLWIWFTIAISFALGFKALAIEIPFVSGGIAVSTIVALAVASPGAPGFVGQFELGAKIALVDMFKVSPEAAIAYAILVHATQFLIQVLVGVVFLAREGLSLRDLAGMKDGEAGEVA